MVSDAGTAYTSHVYFGDRLVFLQRDADEGTQGYYVHQDLQGSIDRLTDAGGNLPGATAYSFAAFGGRRTASGWSEGGGAWDAAHWTERGYTGHEHLDPARLIHMNGRVQDPLLARFLSPDPVLGDLTDPQSLNPYSYVRNSPFRFTDPTGYFDAETIQGCWATNCGRNPGLAEERGGRSSACDRNPQCTVAFDASWTRGGEWYAVWSTGSENFLPGFAWNWDPGSGLNSSDPSVGSWGRSGSFGSETSWGDQSGRWQYREPPSRGPDPFLVPGLPLAICIFEGGCDGGDWSAAGLQAITSPVVLVRSATLGETAFRGIEGLVANASPAAKCEVAVRSLELLGQVQEANFIAMNNARNAALLRGIPQAGPQMSIPAPIIPRSPYVQLPP